MNLQNIIKFIEGIILVLNWIILIGPIFIKLLENIIEYLKSL